MGSDKVPSLYAVYVLQSALDGRHYVGQTEDLERRLLEHQTGLAKYTRNRGPWSLIYQEQCASRSQAMSRERFLKSGQGREWLRVKLSGRAGPPAAD